MKRYKPYKPMKPMPQTAFMQSKHPVSLCFDRECWNWLQL